MSLDKKAELFYYVIISVIKRKNRILGIKWSTNSSQEQKCELVKNIVERFQSLIFKPTTNETTLQDQYVKTCLEYFNWQYCMAIRRMNEVEAYEEAAEYCSDIQFSKFKKAIFQTAEFFLGPLACGEHCASIK